MTKTYKRFAFHEAMKRLKNKDIRRTVVLTGTRRVGKTTIQYQMIEALLNFGVPAQKIVFISMDHPMLKLSQFQDKELNGVSRTTVENYIRYLESANLIYQSWPVDMAGKKC